MRHTPPELRALIVSVYRRGHTYAAIAAALGLDKATVGRIVRQARTRVSPVQSRNV